MDHGLVERRRRLLGLQPQLEPGARHRLGRGRCGDRRGRARRGRRGLPGGFGDQRAAPAAAEKEGEGEQQRRSCWDRIEPGKAAGRFRRRRNLRGRSGRSGLGKRRLGKRRRLSVGRGQGGRRLGLRLGRSPLLRLCRPFGGRARRRGGRRTLRAARGRGLGLVGGGGRGRGDDRRRGRLDPLGLRPARSQPEVAQLRIADRVGVLGARGRSGGGGEERSGQKCFHRNLHKTRPHPLRAPNPRPDRTQRGKM